MIRVTAEEFVNLAKLRGYRYEDSGRLNVVGFRNKYGRENYFDDTIALYRKMITGDWDERYYKATTMPGVPSLLNPVNPKGTAILVEGQYIGYKIGLHRGKYEALVQHSPVNVYRDSNRDDQIQCLDRTIETGLFGINIHRASLGAKLVGPDSAGCQVIQDRTDYEEFMGICRVASIDFGNRFTYTLVEY